MTSTPPNWKHSSLNDLTRTKEPFKQQQKKDKREGIPIMLVQALEYQYTACQRGTAGRSTKSVAPGGCGFVWSVGDGRNFLPPTAFWNPDSPPLLATQHLFVLPTTKCFIFLQAWFIKTEISERDSSWQRPSCTQRLCWLLFYRVHFRRGGGTESSLRLRKHAWVISLGPGRGREVLLKPFAIHFMCVIFLWRIFKNCIWWCRRKEREAVAERFLPNPEERN